MPNGRKFGHIVTEETKQKLRDAHKFQKPPNKGRRFSIEWKENISKAKKKMFETGKQKPTAHWTGKKLSEEHKLNIKRGSIRASNSTRFPKGNIPWNKGKSRPEISGKNHWNWRGGITIETNKRTSDFRWREMAKSVYKRDYYKCQLFGEYARSQLQCHHVKPVRENGNDDMSNLITLCNSHHHKLEISKFQQFWRLWLRLRIPVSIN